MSEIQETFTLRARHVLPVAGPPIAGGYILVRGQRIEAVGSTRPFGRVVDLGDVAIVPGLVNAHTHLEFSGIDCPLGTPGMPLPDWIRQVIGHRRVSAAVAKPDIARGLDECLASGTTTVGEIATHDWRQDANLVDRPRPGTMMFFESIAPTTDRVAAAHSAAEAFLAAGLPADHIWPGISPHAPYTVHPTLLASLVELSTKHRVPLAMHLAESREELTLLQTRGGPFRALLKDLDSWEPRLAARHPRILDYLRDLSRAPRALVIHGNYLADDEIEFLGKRADTMSVVYCPRTHQFFRHERYPLRRMLDAGVALALGTDSRASNPDLNMLEEIRLVASSHSGVSPRAALELGTLGGARALGLESDLGSLAPGKLANLAVIDTGNANDPHEALVAPGSKVVATWLRGRRCATIGSS